MSCKLVKCVNKQCGGAICNPTTQQCNAYTCPKCHKIYK